MDEGWNDQDDWGSMSHREFKRREMEHELGHEDTPEFKAKMRDAERGPWYLKIDGKIYKQKGEPKVFDWKKGANNYGLAILKNRPELKDKIVITRKIDEKAPGIVSRGVGSVTGAVGGIGGALLGSMFWGLLGPIGVGVGAIGGTVGGYNFGKESADAVWDKVSELLGSDRKATEFGVAHAKAANAGNDSFEFDGKEYEVKLKPEQVPDAVKVLKSVKESIMAEEPASRALCTSGKPDSALGVSQLASCKSQGYRTREGGKSHKIGGDRVKVRGKRIKGKKYGGPLPDWS
jgi:hypothetical protein